MVEPTDFDCPTCGASKGHPCQRVSLIPLNHNQRIYLADAAYWRAELRGDEADLRREHSDE